MLMIVSGVNVLFPLLLLVIWLYRRNALAVLTNNVVKLFITLFILTWLGSVVSLFIRPTWTDKVPLVFLFLALMISMVIAHRAHQERSQSDDRHG